MHTTSLRKVGGSIMLAVPPTLLEQLHLTAGSQVGVVVEKNQLVIKTLSKPKYNLSELLAKSDYTKARTTEDQEWLNGRAVGKEEL